MYIKGKLRVASDKSISHRSIILSSIAKGESEINNFLYSKDCLATISCFKKLGISINNYGNKLIVKGKGLYGFKPNNKENVLDCANSGTTMRLLCGLLSAQEFSSRLIGDSSLSSRPMKRILDPLSLMGANIKSNGGLAPLDIVSNNKLKGISYELPIASAQVKSCILFAALYAKGSTRIIENMTSRNHTELMLKDFGANISYENKLITLNPTKELQARNIDIPADISSAAFFITLCLLSKNSELLLKKVNINSTRTGFLDVITDMGANIEIIEKYNSDKEEKSADILIKSSKLNATNISGTLIPRLIDEIPILTILALFCEGTTIISDASELKVKESNRLHILVSELSKLGFDIKETINGMIIKGNTRTKNISNIVLDSHNDHRLAMSFYILKLILNENITILGSESVNISYPNFYADLDKVIHY